MSLWIETDILNDQYIRLVHRSWKTKPYKGIRWKGHNLLTWQRDGIWSGAYEARCVIHSPAPDERVQAVENRLEVGQTVTVVCVVTVRVWDRAVWVTLQEDSWS